MIKTFGYAALGALGVVVWWNAQSAVGQIVINEIVEDERTAGSNQIEDTREFIELYNAGASPVDISGWSLTLYDLVIGANQVTDTFPAGSTIPAGGFWVIGQAAVPNVNFTPVAGELWTDFNQLFELRDGSSTLVDAVALQTFQDPELDNVSQEQLDQIGFGQTVGETATGGWWGQVLSTNVIAPNSPQSLGRYLNGRDTNRNGYDFGMQPVTPGASNNLPLSASHTIPDVDGLTVGSDVPSYYASFIMPRVVDPTVVSGFNPNSIPASPQGGKAIIAYDESGGGNATYSRELVNKFELYAYIDTANLNASLTDNSPQSEATIYGIGTTDPFFGTPNSAGLLTGLPGGNVDSSSNGSTGLGWLIQRREIFNGGSPITKTVLQLVDMNDGGDGVLAVADWTPIETIDLTSVAAGWHRLSIDYNPTTGAVVAKFDDATYGFDTLAGLVGNFYVGYRENLPGVGTATMRPPTYDLFVGGPGVVGDYDGDGDVDDMDYTAWKNTFGSAVTPGSGADGNSNGIIDAGDYTVWRDNLGGPGAAAVAAPEPTGLLLAACGLAILATRRHPRN